MELNFTKKKNGHVVLNDDQKTIWINFTDAEGKTQGFEYEVKAFHDLIWGRYHEIITSINDIDNMLKG
jgi:hypothetical protein